MEIRSLLKKFVLTLSGNDRRIIDPLKALDARFRSGRTGVRQLSEKDFNKMTESFFQAMYDDKNIEHGRSVNACDAFFAYRILLNRAPDSKELRGILESKQTYRDFMNVLLGSEEFSKNTSFLPPMKFWMAELDMFRFWFNTSDREMGVRMAIGEYEPETVALLKDIIKPGMTCIDVGANTGFITCIMASQVGKEGRVYAVEPMPENFSLLLKNIKENNFTYVNPFQKAASDVKGEIRVSKVSNMYVAGSVGGAEQFDIESVPVDDLVSEPVDILKIDVEGHELKAVRGMNGIITRHRPIIISEVNEYWLREAGSDSREYVSLLNSLGYKVYDVRNTSDEIKADSLKMDILDNINIVGFA